MYLSRVAISMRSTDAGGRILATSGSCDVERGCGHTLPNLMRAHCVSDLPLNNSERAQVGLGDTDEDELAMATRGL